MFPFASNENVSLAVRMLMVGRPKRFASAGVRKDELRPRDTAVTESSACPVNFEDADAFSVMVFPVLRFVYECLNEPVKIKVMDPSAAFRTLMNSLSTGVVTRTLNPQNDAGKVVAGGAGKTSHLCPRPASAGEAVTTPPNMPSIAPSATTTRIRLMAFSFLTWLLRVSHLAAARRSAVTHHCCQALAHGRDPCPGGPAGPSHSESMSRSRGMPSRSLAWITAARDEPWNRHKTRSSAANRSEPR